MGATDVMLEPPAGSPCGRRPRSSMAAAPCCASLAAGKRSLVCDLLGAAGRRALERALEHADILIDDTPPQGARSARPLDRETIARRSRRWCT